MNRVLSILLLCCLILSGCGETIKVPEVDTNRDLTAIQQSGEIRALVAYSATSYFLYRGKPMGYEYELLERLAESLDLNLKIVIARDLDEMLEILQRGEVDLVAHGLAITGERKQQVAFADYLYLTRQVLVQRKPDNWRRLTRDQIREELIQDPVELISDTLSLRANSSYMDRVGNLMREIGGEIYIDTLNGSLTTDEIIQLVVDKKIKFTFADQNLARINASQYPLLDVSVPVSFSQRIAWAFSKESPEFLNYVNQWLAAEKKRTDFYVIYNKYFKNRRNFARRADSPFYSLNEGKISPYDDNIQEEARRLGWDWRLLAAVVYQESRFDPEANSWTGASGLMQLMPATAEELGVKETEDPVASLKAGARYLKQLYGRFEEVGDSLQRIKFTLASYNCGYEHVEDARRLAAAKGLDRNQWDHSVDSMLLALRSPSNYHHEVVRYGYVRGEEPYRYVNQIFNRFEHYLSLTP